jgi:hypothetical protein
VVRRLPGQPAVCAMSSSAMIGTACAGSRCLLADPAVDLSDDHDRSEQVRRWLIQIALDAGLTGMERILEHSSAARPRQPSV